MGKKEISKTPSDLLKQLFLTDIFMNIYICGSYKIRGYLCLYYYDGNIQGSLFADLTFL